MPAPRLAPPNRVLRRAKSRQNTASFLCFVGLGLAATGCTFSDSEAHWSDQLQVSGPCYEVNLLDGVERGNTQEFHALYQCLNQQGTVQPLSRLDTALDAPTRNATVVVELYDLVMAIGEESGSFSMAALLDSALAAFDDREGLTSALDLLLELSYAAPISQLGTAVSINSSTSLEQGMLVPMVRVFGAGAETILDHDLAPLAPIAAALRHDDAPRWAWTLALSPQAPDPALAALAADWPLLLADTLALTIQTDNDRHTGPHGDSLRDLIVAVLAEDALVSVGGAVATLLADEYTTDQVAEWVVDESSAGRLDHLDEGLAYLIAVRADGGSLGENDDSALVSLLRLLRNGNQSVDCDIDLGITHIEFSLGNLSVSLLEQLAKIDADSAATGVDLLGDLLGYPLTGAILETVADTGICPVINHELVADLESIDRLSDPAADDLHRSLLGFLQAVDDHIPEVVELATAAHNQQLVEPAEEAIRDLAGEDLADAVLAALPALVKPDGRQATASFPSGVRPVDMAAMATLALALTNNENVESLSPVLTTVVSQSDTWKALYNLRPLLLAGETETSQILVRIHDQLLANPDLEILQLSADQLDNPSVILPALRLVESTAIRGAITDTELANEGALPWLARLHTGGTVSVLFDTLALVRALFGGVSPDA